MLKIEYEADRFPASYGTALSGNHTLNVSWEDLIWSAVVVGKPTASHLFSHRIYSVHDLITKIHSVYANLRSEGGYLVKSNLYEALDPTEKGAVSYFVGMMCCHLATARLLNIPHLFHLSGFVSSGGVIRGIRNSRPDLLGRDFRGNWVIAEAKGRTHGFNASASLKAKQQTRMVRQINGMLPSLRFGAQAYFAPELSIYIEDPDEYDEGADDIQFDENRLILSYYSLVESLTRRSDDIRSIDNRDYRFYNLKSSGISIGLEEKIGLCVRDSNASYLIEHIQSFEEQRSDQKVSPLESSSSESGDYSTYSDGIAIQLSQNWSTSEMEKNPAQRD